MNEGHSVSEAFTPDTLHFREEDLFCGMLQLYSTAQRCANGSFLRSAPRSSSLFLEPHEGPVRTGAPAGSRLLFVLGSRDRALVSCQAKARPRWRHQASAEQACRSLRVAAHPYLARTGVAAHSIVSSRILHVSSLLEKSPWALSGSADRRMSMDEERARARQAQELQVFLEQEKQKAMLNELVAKLTDVCWDKCCTAAPGRASPPPSPPASPAAPSATWTSARSSSASCRPCSAPEDARF